MSGYFDEHNCAPLEAGQTPNHHLHLARLLLDSGLGAEFDMEFAAMFGEEKQPPASKEVVKNLPNATSLRSSNEQCPICLGLMKLPDRVEVTDQNVIKQLPCNHQFHGTCIKPWLEMVNTCPLCKHELPTDDERYEQFKEQKKRQKEREAAIDELHNSMFG